MIEAKIHCTWSSSEDEKENQNDDYDDNDDDDNDDDDDGDDEAFESVNLLFLMVFFHIQ